MFYFYFLRKHAFGIQAEYDVWTDCRPYRCTLGLYLFVQLRDVYISVN